MLKISGFKALAVAAVLLASGSLLAADDNYQQVQDKIRILVPGAEHIAVADSPVPGLLEVTIDTDIVYTSADGRILVQGRLYDIETRQDLTDVSRSKLRRKKIKTIDSEQQIVFAPQDVKYELMVFTDIDCGYCRRLHGQIAEYNAEGIAIRYMLFPRAGIGSHSYEKAVSVWCASDQRSAMTNAKLGNEPEPEQCTNPVADQYNLGNALGVTGTPALLTYDGQLIPGYVPPKALKQRLDALAAVVAAE